MGAPQLLQMWVPALCCPRCRSGGRAASRPPHEGSPSSSVQELSEQMRRDGEKQTPDNCICTQSIYLPRTKFHSSQPLHPRGDSPDATGRVTLEGHHKMLHHPTHHHLMAASIMLEKTPETTKPHQESDAEIRIPQPQSSAKDTREAQCFR